MWMNDGLLIINLQALWSATWRGVLLAIPIWVIYLMIKIKFLEWKEKW